MTDKLKPCPFCGGEAQCVTHHLYGKVRGYSVACSYGCCEQTVTYSSKQGAIKSWNRRKGDD